MPADAHLGNAPDAPYVPAAGRAALTHAYDQAMALTMREGRWRPALTDAVARDLRDHGVVIDVGCGTATQSIAITRARPDAKVIGIDPDPEILTLAAAKPGADRVQLRVGTAAALALPSAHADRIILSLMLHHLDPAGKAAALREARRVLRPDGQLHVLDWGTPAGPLTRAGFVALQLLDGRGNTRDHATGRWLETFDAAGLQPPRTLRRLPTAWGTLQQLVTAPSGHRPPMADPAAAPRRQGTPGP